MDHWFIPAFFISLKDVLTPIAANAQTIINLLAFLVTDTTAAGIGKILATMDIAKNPKINQGNIFFDVNLVPAANTDLEFRK